MNFVRLFRGNVLTFSRLSTYPRSTSVISRTFAHRNRISFNSGNQTSAGTGKIKEKSKHERTSPFTRSPRLNTYMSPVSLIFHIKSTVNRDRVTVAQMAERASLDRKVSGSSPRTGSYEMWLYLTFLGDATPLNHSIILKK